MYMISRIQAVKWVLFVKFYFLLSFPIISLHKFKEYQIFNNK